MENIQLKNYFWILINILIAAVIFNLMFFGMPAIQKFGNSMMPALTLSVTAEGKTIVSPDIADVSFSVVSEGVNPEKLTSANNEKMSAVIENVKSNGVDAKDIKTTNYDLKPSYNYDKNTGRSYIYNYTITQKILVRMRDFKKIASIIGGVTPLGVNQIGNISFKLDEPENFLAQAREEAFKKAKDKAEKTAAINGIKLGKIVRTSEYKSYQEPFFGASSAVSKGGKDLAAIEPGTQELILTVSLTYSIE